jgi:hypothetical protein
MSLRTHRNGGTASLQEVADAWKKEVHNVEWSQSESDEWAVGHAQRLKAENDKAGPAKPDPRNIHQG